MISQRPHHNRTVFSLPATLAACIFTAAVAATPARAEGIDLVDVLVGMVIPGPSVKIEESSPNRQFRFSVKGRVMFADAEDDIERLDGRVTIEERRDGRARRIDFRPAGANGIERIYKVDGRERPLDAEGRRWLAGMIASALREMPVNAQQRASRLHARGGAGAVLSEIERIHSDHARREYIAQLMALGRLDETSFDRLIAAIAAMKSDFGKGGALVTVVNAQALTSAQQVAALKAVAGMHSSFEQRGVLTSIVDRVDLDRTSYPPLFDAIGTMHSNHEKQIALVAVAKKMPREPELVARYRRIAKGLGGHERGQAEKALAL